MNMYFIAIVLPAELNARIIQYKKWMWEKWDCKVGLKSPTHITLIPPFRMSSDGEGELRTALEEVCRHQNSFPLSTADFSAFVPRTLFIAVAPNPQLAALKQSIDDAFFANPAVRIKKETRAFHPHITIATRDLHPAAFYEAWDHFKGKEFRESWTAESVSILKHNNKDWDVWHTVPLKEEEHAS